MRIIALDVGDKRIGVALSDIGHTFASPYCVINRVGFSKDVKAVIDIMHKEQADKVVVGLPKNMNGSLGFQADKVMLFVEQLQQNSIEVILWDERLTTVLANNALIEGKMRREDRRQNVDKVAASFILQSYLDSKKQTQEDRMSDINNQNSELLNEEEIDIVELTDENGEVSKFQFLTTLEHEGSEYVVLMLLPEDESEEESEDGEVIILKIETDEQGEDVYVSLDDDQLSDELFNKFLEMTEEEDEEQ